ncbi:hypothetical protein Cfor_10228 [Coptotermes formosanus]|uniref:G-protein coupled receptors family 1 profile domain-containing protein n=1 Tax=Coptotermes formosanus TaxID=36987 RepID=A0A6L2Q4S1_COPFO|nr:hypothetical protein Cfor_10228 [Coptotermes formosanus]
MALALAFVLLLPCGIYGHSSGHGGVTNVPPRSSTRVIFNSAVDVDEAFERFRVVKKYLDPVILGMIFIFGSVANVTLFVIMARQEEMRSAANACIFSMAVGDTLSLIVNVPIFYAHLRSEKWTVGVTLCKLMWFSSDFAVGVSIFAVAMLSVQRYHGIVNTNVYVYSGRLAVRSRVVSRVIVAFIWILSFSFAVRTAVTSDVEDDVCWSVAGAYGVQFAKNIALMNLFVFCIIPLCVTAVFYGLTARYLFASAREMPGEMSSVHEKIKYARRKGAKTVLGLAVVFFVSYVPWYVWQVVFLAHYNTHYQIAVCTYTVLYYLFFCSLVFNPVALYCVSSTWRRHFNRYLFCVREADVKRADEKRTAAKSKSNFLTSSTNLTALSVEDKGL